MKVYQLYYTDKHKYTTYPNSGAKTVLFKHNLLTLATFSNFWATFVSWATNTSTTLISLMTKNLIADSAWISTSIIGSTVAIGTSKLIVGLAAILIRTSSVVYTANNFKFNCNYCFLNIYLLLRTKIKLYYVGINEK